MDNYKCSNLRTLSVLIEARYQGPRMIGNSNTRLLKCSILHASVLRLKLATRGKIFQNGNFKYSRCWSELISLSPSLYIQTINIFITFL